MPSVKEPSGVKGSALKSSGSAAAIEMEKRKTPKHAREIMLRHCRIGRSAASRVYGVIAASSHAEPSREEERTPFSVYAIKARSRYSTRTSRRLGRSCRPVQFQPSREERTKPS